MKLKYIVIFLILINVVLASWWVLDGNIFFHTDIARDFLLIEDIATSKPLTLIGPRSGAIPGLFHGPLWLYLNLPAFLIGGGNPVAVGWFWVFLYVISLVITYFVSKKLFNKEVGLLAALLLSSVTILYIRALFNPYGALILAPLFFYFFYEYLVKKRIKLLLISFLILGFIIQFQMAFGVPILLLTVAWLIYHQYKNNKLFHLTSLLILFMPLSSHILFELRNNFLQTKSVLNYLSGAQNHGKLDLSLLQLITLRIKEMFLEGFGILTQNNTTVTLALLLIFIPATIKILRQNFAGKYKYVLFFYFYIGFWLMSSFFKGPLWNYYYLPFIPLLILIFVSLKGFINKWLFYIVFFSIYFINLQSAFNDIVTYNSNPARQDVSTWKFNKEVAKRIYSDSDNEFGYFIFTPDLYGYSPRYAMNYLHKKNPQKKVFPFAKKKTTYLLIAPPPFYGRDPNSVWYQKNTNSKLWRDNDIKIRRDPDATISFENDFVIEKYKLSDGEIKVEPNPYLIKDIFFR